MNQLTIFDAPPVAPPAATLDLWQQLMRKAYMEHDRPEVAFWEAARPVCERMGILDQIPMEMVGYEDEPNRLYPRSLPIGNGKSIQLWRLFYEVGSACDKELEALTPPVASAPQADATQHPTA